MSSAQTQIPNSNVEHFLLVFITALHFIAVVMTCARLWIRIRLHRLWWEDAWAFLALCLDIMCAVSTWIGAPPQRDHPWYLSRESHIISTWFKLLSYTSAIWAARISIMFSLIRMIPPSRTRSTTCGFAVFFVFLWALSVTFKVYVCASNRSWYDLAQPMCPLGVPIAVIELATVAISGFVLVSFPVWILCRMSGLPKNERILIISIFSMSLLNVIVGVVHVIFLLPNPGFMAGITADIEDAVDLMNCNLLVLVTSLYRYFRNGEDIEEGTYIGLTLKPLRCRACLTSSSSLSSSLRTTMTLTTVDPEHLETMTVRSTQSAPIPQSVNAGDDIPLHHVLSRSCCEVSI